MVAMPLYIPTSDQGELQLLLILAKLGLVILLISDGLLGILGASFGFSW
jgi:hypothetical protein